MKPARHIPQLALQQQTRRVFLGRTGRTLGSVALASLLNPALLRATQPGSKASRTWPGAIEPLHHPPKIKRVIWLTMAGGPSHLETFDFKPKLAQMDGQPMPESMTAGQQLAQLQGEKLVCWGPQTSFKRFGRCGAEMTELFPHVGSIADELCIIRSMTTDAINHDPAHTFMNTGSQIVGRPSMGSWVTYGLGSDATDLPGFVVLVSLGAGRSPQPIAARQWSSGFLPSRFQGVQLRGRGDPVLYLGNPPGISRGQEHDVVHAINLINARYDHIVDDPEISTRIAQYEMAFRMQSSIPDLTNISGESKATLDLYGPEATMPGTFSHSCLMARRLAERGVRCIEIFHREWDHHGNLTRDLPLQCRDVDHACMGLIKDLKARGMLDETLVVWGGEFGRTVYCQGKLTKDDYGRDHHPRCFTMWMAGGGIKGGLVHGETDDFSYNVVRDPVHIRDINATILHCMGIDHRNLTYRFQGLDQRLTGVEEANPVAPILA